MKLGPERTRLAEHFAFRSSLSLIELCRLLRERLQLPEFDLDSENATEWGTAYCDGLEYNLSSPYEDGTLQAWDSSVPVDCNTGLTVSVSTDAPWPLNSGQSLTDLVPRIGEALAELLAEPIHHHRTWLGPGENITRSTVFRRTQPASEP